MVDGLMRLMDSDPAPGAPVNIGNPIELTVSDLVERVLALTGSHSRIVHRPLPMDDPRRRRPDISRARALLGWEPKVGLQEGLEATAAWFADEQNRSVFFGTPDSNRADLMVSIAAE
jgi:UDP-glucuronate decarboxylase